MSTTLHFISVVILLSTLSRVDGSNGYYTSSVSQCRFTSFDLSDLDFIKSYWFNRAEFIRFNSTVGKFVGYTEFGVYNAERWNKDPAILAQMQAEKDRYCMPNAQNDINNILTKTAAPTASLRLEKASSGDQPAVLMCSAYNFYPRMIKVTWHRDGQEVVGDMTYSEKLADGDWYYQIHSHLLFTPKAGEKISCVVEHASLKEPLEIVWDPSMSKAEWYMIVMGAAEVLLGLIFAAGGFFSYKGRAGRMLAPKTFMESFHTHQKNMNSNFPLWLLSSYKSFTGGNSAKTPVQKSVMNTVS